MSNVNTVTVTINLATGHTATTVLPFEEAEHKDGGTTLDVTASAVQAARAAAATVCGLAGTASGRSFRDRYLATTEAATRRPAPIAPARREVRRGTVLGWAPDGRVRVQPEDMREQAADMSYVRGYKPAAGDYITYIAGSGTPVIMGHAAAHPAS